jgi:hypothetical protein
MSSSHPPLRIARFRIVVDDIDPLAGLARPWRDREYRRDLFDLGQVRRFPIQNSNVLSRRHQPARQKFTEISRAAGGPKSDLIQRR